MPENGKPKPRITLEFDAATQAVQLGFNSDDFKNWDFILGVLEMGKLTAQLKRQEAIAMAMGQAVINKQAEEAIRRTLRT